MHEDVNGGAGSGRALRDRCVRGNESGLLPGTGERGTRNRVPGPGPADILRQHWNWQDRLTSEGWTFSHAEGNDEHWTRPGKSVRAGTSAVLHTDTGVLVLFSTAASVHALHSAGSTNPDGSVTLRIRSNRRKAVGAPLIHETVGWCPHPAYGPTRWRAAGAARGRAGTDRPA